MMNLVRWSPWDRVFDGLLFPLSRSDGEPSRTTWNPLVDIYDNEKAVVIKAELPGVGKEDISIDVSDRVLTLKGERSYDGDMKQERYCRRERTFGEFCRSFTLPADIDPDKIKAEYKDGILRIEIPKPEEQKPKHITVH